MVLHIVQVPNEQHVLGIQSLNSTQIQPQPPRTRPNNTKQNPTIQSRTQHTKQDSAIQKRNKHTKHNLTIQSRARQYKNKTKQTKPNQTKPKQNQNNQNRQLNSASDSSKECQKISYSCICWKKENPSCSGKKSGARERWWLGGETEEDIERRGWWW